MAKAANKDTMNALHNKVAQVFQKVLNTYEKRLDAVESIDIEDIEDEVLSELLSDGVIPNPAMLNAITAFLKNNEIRFETEEVGKLSAMQEALEKRRAARSNVTTLTSLKAVGE